MLRGLVVAFMEGWWAGWEGVQLPATPVEQQGTALALDEPRQVTHQMPAEGLWSLLFRAALHTHRGEDPHVAASLVMAELELEHSEFVFEQQETSR